MTSKYSCTHDNDRASTNSSLTAPRRYIATCANEHVNTGLDETLYMVASASSLPPPNGWRKTWRASDPAPVVTMTEQRAREKLG